MVEERQEVAIREPDTKRKMKYSVKVLGISVAIYIDKLLDDIPDKLVISLPKVSYRQEVG